MNLQQLYYFNAVAEKRNYTKAAKSLYIAQSSLSHSITALERELGVSLFEKDGFTIRLTEFGEIFLRHTKVITDEMDSMWAEIKTQKDFSSEVIKIDAGPFDGINTITKHSSEIIQNFLKHPENSSVRFNLDEHLAMVTMDLLAQGKVDFGFNVYIPNDSMDHYPIIREELVLIVPNNHPLSNRKNIDLRDIGSYPFLIYKPECATRKILENYFAESGCKPNIVAEIINERLIASMVSSNQGISIIPYLPNIIECYDIKAIHIKNPEMSRVQAIFWTRDKKHSPAVTRFIKFMKQSAYKLQETRMPTSTSYE